MNGKAHEDKLLLLFLFLVICLMVVHFSHDPGDSEALKWALQSGGMVLGALLGIMQAARVLRRGGENGKGNNKNGKASE